MTDKQIKEGIDVSQCECYSVEDNSCNKTLSGSCTKEKCQTFRLLQTIKAKEQECEGLKEEIKTNGFGHFNIEMAEQLDKLKKENEKMSKGYVELTEIISPYIDDFTGHKFIAYGYQWADDGEWYICKKEDIEKTETKIKIFNLLQKISECEI